VALPRFFIDNPQQQPQEVQAQDVQVDSTLSLAADSEIYHHVANVLRLSTGKHIEIVQRNLWIAWLCEIEEIHSNELTLKIIQKIEAPAHHFQIDLVLGFSKGDTNEKIVRQATELGIGRIIPVLFDRSISRPDKKRATTKVERLRKIATAAAQQSHRGDLPAIEELQSFDDALKMLDDATPDLILAAWEEESQHSISEAIASFLAQRQSQQQQSVPHVVIVIGPEGGITAEEIAKMQDIGAHKVSLGATILRVDTAAIAALAIACDTLRRETMISKESV